MRARGLTDGYKGSLRNGKAGEESLRYESYAPLSFKLKPSAFIKIKGEVRSHHKRISKLGQPSKDSGSLKKGLRAIWKRKSLRE